MIDGQDTNSQPATGADIARAAWTLPTDLLTSLLGSDVPDSEHAEVRSQFATWAVAHAARTYPGGLFEAWDAFVAPKAGVNAPVVLLPGARCSACASANFAAGKTTNAARPDCVVCRGTGHTRPRLIPARVSSRATPTATPETEIA